MALLKFDTIRVGKQQGVTVKHGTFRKETDKRREIVRELAKSYWEKSDLYIPCIDTQKLFDEAADGGDAQYWSADGVHPTPAGQWLLAQEWLTCFHELL